MSAGFTELLLLVAIILGIFFLPRMTARGRPQSKPLKLVPSSMPRLTGRQRLAVVISVLWPLALAVYLAPWQNGWRLFILIGLGPVILLWSMKWIAAGFRQRNR